MPTVKRSSRPRFPNVMSHPERTHSLPCIARTCRISPPPSAPATPNPLLPSTPWRPEGTVLATTTTSTTTSTSTSRPPPPSAREKSFIASPTTSENSSSPCLTMGTNTITSSAFSTSATLTAATPAAATPDEVREAARGAVLTMRMLNERRHHIRRKEDVGIAHRLPHYFHARRVASDARHDAGGGSGGGSNPSACTPRADDVLSDVSDGRLSEGADVRPASADAVAHARRAVALMDGRVSPANTTSSAPSHHQQVQSSHVSSLLLHQQHQQHQHQQQQEQQQQQQQAHMQNGPIRMSTEFGRDITVFSSLDSEDMRHESQPLPFAHSRIAALKSGSSADASTSRVTRTHGVARGAAARSASASRFAESVGVTRGVTGLSDGGTSTCSSSRAAIARPAIYYAKYGALGAWASDVFTLAHNAVRAECVDLYHILESIHARSHQVSLKELEEFFVWWGVFEVFLIECFDFEADVLFPWVFSTPAVTKGGDMSVDGLYRLRQGLICRKEDLLDCVRQLNGTFELRQHVDATDVFETILSEVNGFVPKLMDYFAMQEGHLPGVVSSMYTAASKDTMIKKYVQYIKRGECPQMNMIVLCRWMDDDVRDRWVKRYLKGYWRLVYRRLERRCFRGHGIIASRFHGRLQRSVRSVAASRLRRRTEFGEEMDDISFSSFPSRGGSIRSLNLGSGRKAFYNKARDVSAPLAHLARHSGDSVRMVKGRG